ncbi:hypothetical protein GQX74_001432 [Glossina fuscipes]|nr:hypothetical protein GQX74_001432 [Glossina fuscipes]
MVIIPDALVIGPPVRLCSDKTKSISLEQREGISKMSNGSKVNFGKNAPVDLREVYNRKQPKTQLEKYDEKRKQSSDLCALMKRLSHFLPEIFCLSCQWTDVFVLTQGSWIFSPFRKFVNAAERRNTCKLITAAST